MDNPRHHADESLVKRPVCPGCAPFAVWRARRNESSLSATDNEEVDGTANRYTMHQRVARRCEAAQMPHFCAGGQFPSKQRSAGLTGRCTINSAPLQGDRLLCRSWRRQFLASVAPSGRFSADPPDTRGNVFGCPGPPSTTASSPAACRHRSPGGPPFLEHRGHMPRSAGPRSRRPVHPVEPKRCVLLRRERKAVACITMGIQRS